MNADIAKSGTILFDFPMPPSLGDYTPEHAFDRIEQVVLIVLKENFGVLQKVFHKEMVSKENDKSFVRLYCGAQNGVTLTLRTYKKHDLVTATLEYDKTMTPEISYEHIKKLEKRMTVLLTSEKKTKIMPEIKRGLKHDIYFNTSDDRILEYDIKEMVFDQQSEFQHVQIARTENYGNILILDDLMNLAESDLVYTQSLMWHGQFDYTGKTVLILGGGDGALLNELLKEKPKHVTMIDIDDVVMQSCKVHLRSACGNVLDNYESENYQIIVGDCVEFMKECIKVGRKFDVVFGDLTDIPVSPTPRGELWDFILNIIQLSFNVLEKDGVYMTHANGVSSRDSLEMFETAVLGHLKKPVDFFRQENYVPSFMERWVFYQIKEVPVEA